MDFRRRIHRPRAINEPGQAHELTFSCYRKHPFLSKELTCQWLAAAIRQACDECQYSLWAYVFMPDHVHLLVHPREREYAISRFLKQVKEPVSRQAVAYLKANAPQWLKKIQTRHGKRVEHHFWQPGRGYDRNIERSGTLLNMVEYIHENPVRRRLVQRACEWKWSSASWLVGTSLNGLQPDPIPWDWLEDLKS